MFFFSGMDRRALLLMGGLEEWVDGWTRGMGGLLVIIHDSMVVYGSGVFCRCVMKDIDL